jgi:hypothetical protein
MVTKYGLSSDFYFFIYVFKLGFLDGKKLDFGFV